MSTGTIRRTGYAARAPREASPCPSLARRAPPAEVALSTARKLGSLWASLARGHWSEERLLRWQERRIADNLDDAGELEIAPLPQSHRTCDLGPGQAGLAVDHEQRGWNARAGQASLDRGVEEQRRGVVDADPALGQRAPG